MSSTGESEVSRVEGPSRQRSAVIVAALLAAHTALVLLLFPPSGLMRAEPINYNDYMLHYYHWSTFVQYMKSDGQPWGYNPYWMAGYPDNTVYDVENKAVEVLAYASEAAGLDDVRVFKWFVFATFIVGPLLTYWAARNFGFSSRRSSVVLALQIVLWHTLPFARVMVVTGAFSYVFVSYLAIFASSLAFRYLRDRETKCLAGFAIICPLALLIHIYAAVIISVPVLVVCLIHLRSLQARDVMYLALIAAGSLLFNSFWLGPFFRFLHYSTVTGASLIQGSLPVFLFWSLLAVVMVPALGLACGFALKGLRLTSRDYGRKLAWFFLIVILFFLVVGALGRYTPVTRMLVALRYHVNAFQYLAFPAALGLAWAWASLSGRWTRRRLTTGVLYAGMILGILVPLTLTAGLSNAPADNNPIAWFFSRRLDHAVVDNPQSGALVDWLRNNTDKSGRILIESVWSPMESEEKAWFYMHFIPILPMLTDREFIGGPRDDTLLLHHFPSFHLDFVSFEQLVSGDVPMVLFGKKINSISQGRLREYFDLYNVTWVVCSRPISKQYFDRQAPFVQLETKIGEVWIYRVDRTPSYLVEGKGTVEATYNRIRVEEFQGKDAVLKYHWMEGLRTRPQLPLERIMLMDDPIGFIRIPNAPSSFEIYNDYEN